MAYLTKALYKTYKGISGSGDDDLIDDFIEDAQELIDNVCHRTFEATSDTTQNMDAVADVDGRRLWLPDDLAAITTVTNGDSSTVASNKYVTEPRNSTPYYALTLKSDAGISWTYTDAPEDAISITGRWAYSTSADAGIRQVMLQLVDFFFTRKDAATDTDQTIISGGIVITPSGLAMPRSAYNILQKGGYIRTVI